MVNKTTTLASQESGKLAERAIIIAPESVSLVLFVRVVIALSRQIGEIWHNHNARMNFVFQSLLNERQGSPHRGITRGARSLVGDDHFAVI